jgi:hypothetical protein
MNLENAIVTADNDDVWTKATVVYAGSKLQVLVPFDGGGVNIVATFSGVDYYETHGRKHIFRSSTEMTNQYGDSYTEVIVVPQSSGCGSCSGR